MPPAAPVAQVGSALLLACLLVVAPLVYGANRPLPLLLLQILSVPLLIALALGTGRLRSYPPGVRVGLGLLAGLPLLYLVPLPLSVWVMLPGRALYGEVLGVAGAGADWRVLSVLPEHTELTWLSLLPPLVVLWAVLSLSAVQIQRLVVLVLLMAGVQAGWALVQFGAASQMISGTYANRNHLAGFLNLCLPAIFAGLALGIGHQTNVRRAPWQQRLLALASSQGFIRVFHAALGLLVLLGIVFSQSRAGIALMILGIILSLVFFAPRLGGLRMHLGVGGIVVIALGCALAIGLLPVVQRFGAQEVIQDGRWVLFGSTLQGIHAFFPFGSGPGTFPEVYPRFQPPGLALFVNHAHNDYLEALFETGLPAAVLLLLFLGLYARHWMPLLRSIIWTPFQFMQVGAGIGVLLMLLHSFVDFNLRIPANTIYFAFWLGVFWHDGWHPHVSRPVRHSSGEDFPQRAAGSVPPVEPARNPFLD